MPKCKQCTRKKSKMLNKMFLFVYEIKWNEKSDMTFGHNMVTHIWNLGSAINPSKVHTHSSEHTHTHTPWTHTRSSGMPFMLRLPGSSWGFGALLKGTSVVVLRVERALYILSPHLQFLPAGDSNSQPFDYKSLTIRPQLPPLKRSWISTMCRAVI